MTRFDSAPDPYADWVKAFMVNGAKSLCATRGDVSKCEALPETARDTSEEVKKWLKATEDALRKDGWRDIKPVN